MNRAQRRHPVKPSHHRTVDARSLPRLIARLEPFTSAELLALQTPVRVAFESLRTGSGTEPDFHTLAAAVNTSLIRSEAIDPLCVETCQRAQAALLGMLGRFKRLGAWGVDHHALQDIPPALDLHEQLLELSTPLQMANAMQETLQRMNDGHVYRGAA
jgi:hypothetical protein